MVSAMSETTIRTHEAKSLHSWTRKGEEATYVLGHASASCPLASEGAAVPDERTEDPWPCGSCIAVARRESTNLAHVEIENEDPVGASRSEREPVSSEEDPREVEAIEFAKAYEGDFDFMVSMREKCSRVVVRLSPKMIDAILRCKARAEKDAAAPADVKVNRFAGTCGTCRNEVAEEAGRVEKVDGRWVTFHLDGTCPPVASKAPESHGEARSAAPAPSVPEGRYAFATDEGHIAFAKVDTPTEGRWAGRTFVNLLIGSPGSFREQPMKGESGKTILRKIEAAGVRESAVLFGRKTKHCGRCLADLSRAQSRAAGYGATCAAKYGWYYPSKAEALAILDEENLDTEGITDLV